MEKEKKTKTIDDLPKDKPLTGVKFKHPETGEVCVWVSQWGYPGGSAGVWYRKPGASDNTQIYPIFLNRLQEAIKFEVVED